jgi:hypothetical protein
MNSEDTTSFFTVLIIMYILGCVLVAAEAKKRGWEVFRVFLICLFASPLIGAILFSQYKKDAPLD